MQKRWFVGLFLMVLCASFTFAQNVKKQADAQWEFLQVSTVRMCSEFGFQKSCRRYEYLTSGESFDAPDSLEWMRESGWQLVGVSVNEGYQTLYFKRSYNKTRTDSEIERLKKEFLQKSSNAAANNLTDLDMIDGKQKLNAFNRSEESRIRTALEQISGLQLKIISLSSEAASVKSPRAATEIVLDATSVLLKDGNQYRSSEADKYFQDAARLILEKTQTTSIDRLESNAQLISNGNFELVEIGKFRLNNPPNNTSVTIKLSVIVNYNNNQNIVAQGWIYGRGRY